MKNGRLEFIKKGKYKNGYFYGRVINDGLRSIRKVESFYSPSLEELYHQIALRNNDFERKEYNG